MEKQKPVSEKLERTYGETPRPTVAQAKSEQNEVPTPRPTILRPCPKKRA